MKDHLYEKFLDKDNVEHDVCIGTAHFCAMLYFSSGWYLLFHEAPQVGRVSKKCVVLQDTFPR